MKTDITIRWVVRCFVFFIVVGFGVGCSTDNNSVDSTGQALTEIADNFFLALAAAETNQAHAYLARETRESFDEKALKRFLLRSEMLRPTKAVWRPPIVQDDAGLLVGEVTNARGRTQIVTVQVVREVDGWKLAAIKPGMPNEYQLPDRDEQIRLAKQAVLVFGESVANKSMNVFHAFVSQAWRAQKSVEQFDESYGSFFSLPGDIRVLADYRPEFDPEPTLVDAQLSLVGYFPTEPNRLVFKQTYIYEGLGWKLIGFSAAIQRK